MSSEEKSLDPSDKGPSPPPCSSGATPTRSPTPTDKRPRGRPRKDALSTATSLPSVPRQRKKNRGRGKALVEDEDSTDGMETAETGSTQETVAKGQQEEMEDASAMAVSAEVEEEEQSSSPLPASSKTGAAQTSSASGEAKSSEQLCAFCYCGGRSLLGQGDLKPFRVTPGYDPPPRQSSTEEVHDHSDKTEAASQSGKQRGLESVGAEEAGSRFWDELRYVGLPDDIDVQTFFESGQCWAHQSCALWSNFVCQAEDQSLLYVDKAIHSGSTEHCAYCKRLGASIKCCEEGCDRSYHYPCVGAAGTFQDFRRRSVLCTEHIELAISKYEEEANCILCDSPGDLLDQFFCTSCGLHYHGMCLDISVTPLKRAGWQCPECKVCQTCKEPGEDTKMLVCDVCDKGYHTFCLQPAMDSIPTNGWRCKNCRMCVQCGTRSSEQWHHNSLLCQKCGDQQDTTHSCLCPSNVVPEVQKDLLSCYQCKRWFHPECERPSEGHTHPQPKEDHICSTCRTIGIASGPMCTEADGVQAEIQSDVGAEEATQLVPSNNDSEPAKVQDIEPYQPVREMQNEEKQTDEKQMMEIGADSGGHLTKPESSKPSHHSAENEMTSDASPLETKGLEDEQTEQKLDLAPEASTVQQLETYFKTEEPPEMSASLKENISKNENGSKPCLEEQKINLSPTKEPAPACTSHEGEPMEVLFTEEPSAEAHGVTVEPEVSTAENTPLIQSQRKIVQEQMIPPEIHTKEMDDITVDGDHRCLAKLTSLVEERTSLQQPPRRQPEGLLLGVQGTSQPQALTQNVSRESFSNVPSSAFIPITPKIGMGKPAISKRKFSPGRPRVKQGAWSRRPSSPSWSLDPTEGWDGLKSRQPHSTAAWIIRVQGRGSGFPGRRRPRGSGVTGRGGRGRARMKNGVPPIPTPGVNIMEPMLTFKEEEETAMHSTVVIFSSADTFTLKQDMCVVCGSFGQGVEGRLIACAQCGQCYHPYCVNIKITKVVLSKGWRCLECTVCEACGQASDPGRLLLCDDCDISYHTYCLDPPLQNVPNGSWKCKWCVSCTQCGATSAGLRCEWQNNYTQCAPCASLASCPLCQQEYKEEEIILQCRQCDRWMHASCQGIHSEEEVEKVADTSFDCNLCQGHIPLSPAPGTPSKSSLDFAESVFIPQRVTKTRDHDLMRTYTQDGVCLTESGLSQLQSLANAASRRRRSKPKLKLKIINQNSVAVLQTPPDPQTELSRDGDLEDTKKGEMVDGEVKSDSSPEREPTAEDDSKDTDACKKRKRKPYRPGIGGFMVRQRNRTGPGRTKPAFVRKDSTGSETLQGKDEGWGDQAPDTPVDEKHPLSDFPDNPEVKIRKRYRKKKTKLEEAFPTYLQEAFFGKDLLDKSKQNRQQTTRLLEDERERKQLPANQMKPFSDLSLNVSAAILSSKAAAAQNSVEPLVDLSEELKSDTELLGMFSDNIDKQTEESGVDFCPFQVEYSTSPFGLDIAPLAEDESVSSQAHLGRTHSRMVPEEPLDGILSPELDKMVTDESILSRLYKIPELGGKDVEDLFTAVLSPSTSQPAHMIQQIHGAQALHGTSGPGFHPSQANSALSSRVPVMNGLMESKQQFSQSRIGPGAGPEMAQNIPPMQRMPFSDNLRDRKFNLISQETAGPWSATGSASSSAPAAVSEVDGDSMSTAQKSTLKWEKEETLGELATVAPVLYTNVNFPNLKEEYPDWSTRVKQIAKLWRKASSQDRAPYVQKARDNRAALRINKVQISNEPIKRQPPQPQQPLEVFDPAIPPLDPELLFKDPLKHKESEHEQEWKFRQQMRQKSKQQAKIEATQKLEQVKNEQRQQQQVPGSQSDHDSSGNLKSPGSVHSNSGDMSPNQPSSKNGVSKSQLLGTSCSPDDLFLRPHPPPQSSGSQPQSPQMFSPNSSGSRPSSPWDPYTKMVGTPRPPPSSQGTPRRNSESGKSPKGLSEPIGSPTAIYNDPYAKPPDTPRPAGTTDPFLKPMCPPRPSQTLDGRHVIGSPNHDSFSRMSVRKEAYQRIPQGRMILSDPYARPLLTPIPGSNESGSVQVFKTPMPPPQAQEQYVGMHARRASADAFERPIMSSRSNEGFSHSQQNDPYAQPPLTPRPVVSDGFANQRISRQPQSLPFSQPGPMTRQPSCNPYSRAPSTPRPDYSQCDPYVQQPATPRPSSDPFAQSPFSNPYARMPGTPRPHDPEPYSQQTTSRHPVLMNQPSQQSQQQTHNRIMSPISMDPYTQHPSTPRSGIVDPFPKSPSNQRTPDPFNQPPGLPRCVGADPHTPSIGRSQLFRNDSCSHLPRTPHHGVVGQALVSGPLSSQDPFSPPQVLMQESFSSPTKHGPQTLKHLGMTDDSGSQPLSNRPNQTPIHDRFEQTTMLGQCGENKDQQSLVQSISSHIMGQPASETQTIPLAEAEERLRQRQRIRELILKQQQQKSAIRQDKVVQDHTLTMSPATPQHWNLESTGQQSEMFNHPPPPYPGPGAVRAPQRFYVTCPRDRQGQFPEGQLPRPQFTVDADSNTRQLGTRMPLTPGIQGPLGAIRPHLMQDSIEAHPQMRRSMSMDLGKSIGGSPLGTPHMPPRGMHVQQHNIMGQPFIELRHRTPDSRLRLSFGPPVMQGNRMESPSQQRAPGFLSGQEMVFPFNQIPKSVDTTLNQPQVAVTQMQTSLSLGNLQQPNISLRAGHPQIPLTRSISQPASNETLSSPLHTDIAAVSAVQNDEVPLPTNEVPEEKIDTVESAVKELEDVEVKDLVDADLENLNLDPDDGKDLDLETNDLHLDDFLKSGKFDIIAYTDADLDLSEDLDLSDTMEDNTEMSEIKAEKKPESFDTTSSSSCSTSAVTEPVDKTTQSQGDTNQEIPQDQVLVSLKQEDDNKNGIKDCLSQGSSCSNQISDNAADNQASFESDVDSSLQVHPDATPMLSGMLVSVPPKGKELKQEQCGKSTEQNNLSNQESTMSLSNTMLGQGNFSVQGIDTGLNIDQSLVSSHDESALEVSSSVQEPQQSHIFGIDQKDAVLSGEQNSILTQQAVLSQQGHQNRPLLLEEQPLLLQDLLDQERQEQQQQKQMQAMIRQRSSDSFFPNIDFDAITDPIMKAKMVALKGINKMMVQNNMGMSPMVVNNAQTGQALPDTDGNITPVQLPGQDSKLGPHIARPDPPNFGTGFAHDTQKTQYEDWLRETQQLLQMQQKFLEEQIGAHRKSKKALSAKQRTAKKAGREFPEEDAEQLKHVTEQQGVVQKQLEQIRKQQKEHAELIEEYRVKQQQQGAIQPPIMPGMQPPGGMMQVGPPINQSIMGPMMPIRLHSSQPDVTKMPNTAGWHPGTPVPTGGPRMPGVMPAQVVQAQSLQPAAAMPTQGQAGGESPHVNFDDTNPFSEGFQERERKERLREQQERQRMQIIKEVERQHVKHCVEQQVSNCQDGTIRGLSQMPFYNQELPQDFMQPPRLQQQMQGPTFLQPQGTQQGYIGGTPRPLMGNGPFPQEMGPSFAPQNLAVHGSNLIQAQTRPQRYSVPHMMPQNPPQGHPFPMEGPTPLPPNFPGPGPSLIQLYSNIIPEEKGKKKRNQKKKKDEDCESLRAPSTPHTPHSDMTAPLTPCVSDTSSTPTRNPMVFGDHEFCETSQPGSSTPGSMSSQPHSELERQLSEGSCGGGPESAMGHEEMHDRILSNIKLEKVEATDCHGHKAIDMEIRIGMVKVEREIMLHHPASQSPANSSKEEGGNELLKHLLKNKRTPPHALPHQRSEDSLRSEEEGSTESKAFFRQNSMDSTGTFSDSNHHDFPGPLIPEDKKKQRNKRTPKSGERPAPRCKKRKKEEDESQAVYSSIDPVITPLKQQHLSLLPLMEPLVGVNFAHLMPYGGGELDGENRLSGTFGSASLDGVSDYYSQLIYKQNNLSNPPTPPASLPPTPPPVARQKLLNGFATTEELARKGGIIAGHDVTKGLLSRPLEFKAEEELLAQALAQGPKTVNVPASLPTPPHNNQEELRGQEHCEDRNTPDSFVPSSSPESVVGMEISRYPDLSLVKEEPPSPAMSPVIPMFPVFRDKGSDVKLREVKTEPSSVFFDSSFRSVQNGSNSGLVSIAIMLKPAAAENITDVVAAIADLIRVKIPSSYEVSSGPGGSFGAIKTSLDPQCLASALPNGPRALRQAPQHLLLQHNHNKRVGGEQYRDGQVRPGSKQQWCQHCKVVVLGKGVRKITKDEEGKPQESRLCSDGGLVFCSHSCLILHSSSSQANGNVDNKASVSLLSESALKQSFSKVQHQYSNNMSSLDVHCLAQLQPKPSSPTPYLHMAFAPAKAIKTESKPKSLSEGHLKVTVKLKPRLHSHLEDKQWHHGKRWKGLRWRKWTIDIAMPKVATQSSESELEERLKQLTASLRPCLTTRDQRRCCFCQQIGDGMTDGPARLLNLDLDTWVHLNCALWSSEVYETQAGALINVGLARQRGQTVFCAFCQRLGATSGCHRLRCLNIYHFTCALQAGCTFFKDKTMLCHQHRPRGAGAAAGLHVEHQLRCFSVFRRVYVQRDELRQLAAAVQQPERGHTFRVGSLLFHAMGQLPPALMPTFHSSTAIFPPGYEASRLYWSMRHGQKRCRYVCSIEEHEGRAEFSIRVIEQGYEDLVLTDTSAKGVWEKVLGPVAERRAETGMLRLFPIYLKGEDLFGLTISAVTRIAESLPGVEACSRYRFRYGRNPMLVLPLSMNSSGSARSELQTYPQHERLKILSSWPRISRCIQNSTVAASASSHSKHFVHSKSSQYRRLTSDWKSNVYLAHSRIQGLGLFAARAIEKQTMVIEYMGDILRTEVAMRRELLYKAKNRPAYMFCIDSERVIDATNSGSPARYINHSCLPNCVAEVVTFERGYKIIISAACRIERGEELCYDYKLTPVNDQSKIPCHCGAAKCRKWIN
ncbi:histone-lysine N-methyltransferase 2C isoform X7 [Danio aesculapii]|uniref:histone-lysine N-methyltransferase 2C isoform X7 n=1 Tax=Danio aesculapii TaxID=1142201 RepID=UPI0024C02AE4|nr:histone-lysine N-methyltransferase 2C isoform X7 [Danio aesculapii]